MKQAIRIAANIQAAREDSDALEFKAALPLGALLTKSLDKQEVERARAELEDQYRVLVQTLRGMRPHLRDGNVLRYWMFGDAIVQFENQTAHTLVFVDKLSEHLARDVNYSKTMIDLCRRFRQKFADIARVDPTLSFDAYHRSGFDPKRAAAYAQSHNPKRTRERPRKN